MASSLRSHGPARTPSRTSHAFRSPRNDFSPFGSITELNAAITQMHSPRGDMYSDRGRTPVGRAPSHNLPPHDEDEMGSFYGEEVDYGKVQSQLHPNGTPFQHAGSARSYQPSPLGSRLPSINPAASPPPSHFVPGSKLPSHHPSQAMSHQRSRTSSPERGWVPDPNAGHGPPSHNYGEYGVHHAFDYEEEFLPPMPPQVLGSRAGTAHGGNSERNYVPTIQVPKRSPPRPRFIHPRERGAREPASTTHHTLATPSRTINSSTRSPSVPRAPEAPAAAPYHSRRRRLSQGRAHARRYALSLGLGRFQLPFETDGDDVILQVWLPWTERLNEMPCRFHITGVDGKHYSLEIDYQWTKMVHGTAKFRGAGMPRERGKGRGHLIIEWEIWFQEEDEDISD
ncbi:hypothetical protein DFP72DRAFT_898985 [Ephemerocybe angulata]|uniref:Uncharacterized protein n=1 Tax=Ephemerocybe angulata TaxID=980116 RepID=A0A8H6HZ22_9AGAR|nr:hypothetical protein DFP72DRAFT_898985 [Tulosesus angulatus]